MFQVGDIVRLHAPTVGKQEYHLCVYVGTEGAASPRYNDRQLALYQATRMGALPRDVAQELIPFVKAVEVLNKADRDTILSALLIVAADP
jgi:hypothetical protein